MLNRPGLRVTACEGAYGIEYEIQTSSIWKSLRLHAVLSELPPDATLKLFPGDMEDDEAGDGVLVLHYWRDTRNRATVGGRAARTQISKPTE